MPAADQDESKQPNLFIIGAPKCGTTTLARWLGGLPQVYLSDMKEPHYYNTDEKQVYITRRPDYLALYREATKQHIYRLDASVWYLHSDRAVPNILKDCPAARFIVCLRNPVGMAYSLHGQYLNKTFREHITSFRQAWEMSDERLAGRAVNKRATDPRYLAYKYSCRIGSQSLRLLERISRDSVHFVVLDDIVGAPEKVQEDLFAFLSLERTEAPPLAMHNVRVDRKWRRGAILLNNIGRFKSAMGLGNVKLGLLDPLRRMNESAEKKKMDPRLREELTDYFSDEIRIIWKIVGRTYPSWFALDTPNTVRGTSPEHAADR